MQGRVQDYWYHFVRNMDEADLQPQAHSTFWEYIYQTISAAVAAVVILCVIFMFCFRGFGVTGSSMEPTLHDGDWVAASGLSDVQSGDVIIFTKPNDGKLLVKRVIATGGQTVNIDFVSHVVTIDDKVLDESYIAAPTETADDVSFPVDVPQGKVFVLGDNRNNSIDSRSSTVGLVDEDSILGVVKLRLFPLGSNMIIR